MDKLLFLDFDGVLNAFNYNKELYMQRARAIKSGVHHTEAPPIHDCFGALFCPDCVEQLKRIITATGADIVITSTWRKAGINHAQVFSIAAPDIIQHDGTIAGMATDRTQFIH